MREMTQEYLRQMLTILWFIQNGLCNILHPFKNIYRFGLDVQTTRIHSLNLLSGIIQYILR